MEVPEKMLRRIGLSAMFPKTTVSEEADFCFFHLSSKALKYPVIFFSGINGQSAAD
jgi:hypothetical protein